MRAILICLLLAGCASTTDPTSAARWRTHDCAINAINGHQRCKEATITINMDKQPVRKVGFPDIPMWSI